MDLQKVLASLKPGDIILDRGDSWISNTISYLDNSQYTHAMIYEGGNKVLHATNKGVITKPILDVFLHSQYFQVYRLIDRSVSTKKVIDNARRFTGRAYSKDQFILLALLLSSSRIAYTFKLGAFARVVFEKASLLLMSYRDDDIRVTCSEMVHRSFTEVYGRDVLEIDRGYKKSHRTINLIEEFRCYDAWMMSSKIEKSDEEIEEELKLLFSDLQEEGKQLDFNKNNEALYEFKQKGEIIGTRENFMNVCQRVKENEVAVKKGNLKINPSISPFFLTFLQANSNFITPGDLSRSPSLYPVFEAPIPLNKD